MAYFCLYFWLFLTAVAAQEVSFRIMGGEPTAIQRYPSLVQVEYADFNPDKWQLFGGASILTERYVLSAAHCFSGEYYSPLRRRIRAGATEMGKDGIIVYVEREFNHPKFGHLGLDSDITVVLLATPLIYSPEIRPATIPAQGTVIPDNSEVVVAGWGATSDNDMLSDVLQHTTLFTINNQVCAERYIKREPDPGIVTENMICAGLLDIGERDACHGDSGAALYLNGSVVGLVSWGRDCASPIYPGVYTNVANYADWIWSIAS